MLKLNNSLCIYNIMKLFYTNKIILFILFKFKTLNLYFKYYNNNFSKNI